MKFLEYTPLSRVSAFLQRVNLGDCVVQGEIQAYSCKLAGVDKKLSRSLDSEVVGSLSTTPPSVLSASPVGPLTDANSRKTLIYLILTLNHMYPDYDFSYLRAHHFTKEMGPQGAKNDIENLLLEASKVWAARWGGGTGLIETLWWAINESVELAECDVYSLNKLVEEDPFSEEGHLWAFTLFFYNKRSKRILCFSCRAVSKAAEELNAGSDSEGEEPLRMFHSAADEDLMEMDME